MKMKIRIKKEHLKDADYMSNTDCPLARALKGLGFRNVGVGGRTAFGTKKGKQRYFSFYLGCSRVEEAQKAGNKPFTITVNRDF